MPCSSVLRSQLVQLRSFAIGKARPRHDPVLFSSVGTSRPPLARRRLVVVGVVGLDWTNRVACARKRRTQLCSVAAAVLVRLSFFTETAFFCSLFCST